MARTIKPLTEKEIKSVKPEAKEKRLADGNGLYLSIKPTGGKLWRLKYRINDKEKLLALGKYPEISLAKARQLREEYRAQIANGIDPSEVRKEQKQLKATEENKKQNTFNNIAEEFFASIEDEVTPKYLKKLTGYYNNNVRNTFPQYANKPIDEITRKEIIQIIEEIEKRDALEVAKKTLNTLERIFKFAVTKGKCEHNIIADLDKGLMIKKRKVKHHAAITDEEGIKRLLIAINEYKGDVITKHALKLASYLAVRPIELRSAEWKEIDFEKSTWRIPAQKMKMRQVHIVPLTSSVISILRELQQYTGYHKCLFPNSIYKDRYMSENTLNTALRRMGFTKEEMVSHGFRGMFSTVLHENITKHGYHSDVIEKQLAHSERNSVKAAYAHVEYLEERQGLMRWWSNYLDDLLEGKS